MSLLFSPRIPALDDPRLRDFGFLCCVIDNLYSYRAWRPTFDLDAIAVTVANRLANLINRLERTTDDATCIAARWYLENVKEITIVPMAVPVVNPLIDRLERAVHAHETRAGYQCPSDEFGRLVGTTNTERCLILYGPPTTHIEDKSGANSRPSPFSTYGRLTVWISFHCWRCYPGE